jgi:uncharacterized protein (TIGR02147 family)
VKTRPRPPRVFDYLDYREYLADHHTHQAATRAGYSYRQFAARARLGSPNYLKLVIEGRRNLSDAMAERFGETCGLAGDDLRYFCTLVRFNQADATEAKAELRGELVSFSRFRTVQQLATDQFSYFSHWFIPAVRELIACAGFRNDPGWIASVLRPAVTVAKVRRTLEVLLNLKLVREHRRTLVHADPLVTSGLEAPGDLLANYHREMMRMGAESIDRFPRHMRDVSSITFAVGPDGLRDVKERVQRFRREILELSGREATHTQVVQLNLQLFPLSAETPSETAPCDA